MTIAIVDYNAGNIASIQKKMQLLNSNFIITNDPNDIEHADKLILPGVGHFANAMQQLNELNLIESLNNAALVQKKPILGICLGLQLMCKFSEEGNCNGLGWIDAEVVKFQANDPLRHKTPHIGWNSIDFQKDCALSNGIPSNSFFYFVHSYHLSLRNESDSLYKTTYDYPFVSGINQENLYGVQFHPEKSHDSGLQMLKNFIEL